MRTIATIVIMMVATSSLSAQYERRYEVGLFGAFTKYDKAFNLASKIGGGVRFAYAFPPMIDSEVEALFPSPQDVGTVHLEPLIGGGSLVVNALNAPRMSVYVLGGYSRLDFGATSPYRFTDGGFHGGAGAKFFMSSRFALRFEARGIYTPSTTSAFPGASKSATHLVASAGLAFFQPDAARHVATNDEDGDGVPDGIDKCPHTPKGATVDATGCPHDSDGDGVLDGIDQCPNTPPGTKVDEKGCPLAAPNAVPVLDSDGDGVPDTLDKCPNTPAGAKVDADGCPIDSDHDGVWDGLDKCPDTPAGATVDKDGCPHDSDGDGVFDGIDQCPNTPPGVQVDAVGCPLDSDKDGVPDYLDKCPNTPPGIQVDANGCPIEKDSDGDGVPDSRDRCPNTPPGSKVDQFGCVVLFEVTPVPPGAPPARPTLILQGVNFQTGRSILTRESYAVLDQVAASLVANPEIRIEIAGYTDSTGRKFTNMRLSMGRAGAVQHYLARKGVSPMRMRARGFGASGYIAPNSTPEGRAKNRRVELHKLN